MDLASPSGVEPSNYINVSNKGRIGLGLSHLGTLRTV